MIYCMCTCAYVCVLLCGKRGQKSGCLSYQWSPLTSLVLCCFKKLIHEGTAQSSSLRADPVALNS